MTFSSLYLSATYKTDIRLSAEITLDIIKQMYYNRHTKQKEGAYIMSRDELIKAIREILEQANRRELDLIYRMLKTMTSE